MDKIPNHLKIGVAMVAGIFLAIFFALVINTNKTRQRTFDLMKRELNGILVEVEDLRRGSYRLKIKQHQTNKILEYTLHADNFVNENNIKVTDSISKTANNNTIIFYKKYENGVYNRCCELVYY